MKKEKKFHSFATRLSQWVMLVLFVMMSALAIFIYYITGSVLLESEASTIKNSMKSAERSISDMMSDVMVATDNNVFDIERNLSKPDEMQAIVERIVKQNKHIRSCGISFIENYYPSKGRQFCPYAWRSDSSEVQVQRLGDVVSDYLNSKWFKEVIAKDSAYWSDPFVDGHDGKTPLVAFLQPIHDQQGRVVAVMGADLSLDFMTEFLEEQDSLTEDAMLVAPTEIPLRSYMLSQDGTYLTHPESWHIMKGNFFQHVKDYDGEEGMAKNAIKEMKEKKVSNSETDYMMMINRTPSYLFYAPVKGTDWILVVVAPRVVLDFMGLVVGLFMLVVVLVIIQVTFLVCRFVIKRSAKPLKVLADAADMVAQGHFDTQLPSIKHNDEIHQLRDSFENMQQSLATYVEDLKTTTAAKASIENELEIAHGIQMSMLPKIYPAFPDRNDIDIYGQVTPAKAVGGDLYDFFIHDEKLFFCIGDVSGKGVPASLVMAVTRSLFRNIAAHTAHPDRMVTALNEALSDNNETNMFVTLFVGVLDLSSGHLSYSNAGHDMPLLLTDDEVIVLSCDANVPAGVIPGWTFTCQQLEMKTGTMIFLYTDGLNEAEDIHHNQFGMERMQQTAMNATRTPQQFISIMREEVAKFVGDAEQSDDLTMLAIQYKK